MTEDQSVVGRRRIYYDQTGGEALICSDSEEEVIEDEEEKRDFLESEDYILRLVHNLWVCESYVSVRSLCTFFFYSLNYIAAIGNVFFCPL